MAAKITPKKAAENEDVTLGVRLGVNQARILEMIAENKFVTRVAVAEKIGISSTAVENNIAKLKAKGILKRGGPDKGGYWEIPEKSRRRNTK